MRKQDNIENGRIEFAIVGSGWRSEFFLRIARQLPARFSVVGIVVRDPDKGATIESTWGAPTFRSIDDLARATSPDFVVVAVQNAAAVDVISQVVSHGLAVLTETPPGGDIDAMNSLFGLVRAGARIQVAEQYHLEPLLSAQIGMARSGLIGNVDQAQVSLAHDYHGISIIRRALGVRFEDAVITASRFDYRLVMGPSRLGDPQEEKLVPGLQTMAKFEFEGKLGVYDFAPQQYRSWIRSNRLLIRGDRGEINNTEVRYLKDFRTPMRISIERMSTGEDTNLEGDYLRGLTAGGDWVYTNDFIPARFMDDEIAIATCLVRMAEHVNGGPDFYSLADAAQDNYLHLMMRQAVERREPVTTSQQQWATPEG